MSLTKATFATRRAFGERVLERGADDADFVLFESDLGKSSLSNMFGDAYPARYFNMGIAELNTMAAAAGMAAGGRTVFVAGYSVFMTMRALEAVRSFICYPKLNVKLYASHGGLTAAIDGVTHQGSEDIAFMTTLPNMKVLVPADSVSARAACDLALATPGPIFVRLMRDPLYECYEAGETFEIGGSKIVRAGRDITIASYGDIVFQALQAADTLAAKGIEAEVLDLYSVKPVDAAGVLQSVRRTGSLLVAENHQKRNGLGYDLAALLLKEQPVPFDHLGLDDRFAESGNYLAMIDKYGFSAAKIVSAAEQLVMKAWHRC
ncbi:MAG: transketolase family protein [Acidobacteria bacterium]|nr:transketolase family protein [Acidobacteriota bacterium]